MCVSEKKEGIHKSPRHDYALNNHDQPLPPQFKPYQIGTVDRAVDYIAYKYIKQHRHPCTIIH